MAEEISRQDEQALAAIEKCAETFAVGTKEEIERKGPVTADQDRGDFSRIANPHYQRFAAASIADNMRESAAYKSRFTEAERKKVDELNKVNDRIASEKEDRKAADFTRLSAEEKAMLKGNEPEAWTIEPTDVRTLRARETEQGQEKKSAKQPEQAKGGEQAKGTEQERDAPGPQSDPKGGNTLESDELFATNGADADAQRRRRVIPKSVSKKYDQEGNTYTNRWNKEHQWVDKTDRIETNTRDANTVSDIVRVAEARGWDDIKVNGSEDFRRQVYLEAAKRGMSVRGYQPTQQDIEQVAQASRNSPEGQSRRATTATTPTEAQELDARTKAEERGKQQAELPSERPGANAQADAFRTMPAKEAVKAYPELAGSYAVQEQAQRVTQEKNMTPEQAKVFQDRVNKNLENAIERGEPAKAQVQIKEREAGTQQDFTQQLSHNAQSQEQER